MLKLLANVNPISCEGGWNWLYTCMIMSMSVTSLGRKIQLFMAVDHDSC